MKILETAAKRYDLGMRLITLGKIQKVYDHLASYVKVGDHGTIHLSRAYNCIQCGACIIQCPVDVLYFEGPKNTKIAPSLIRKYKLNMLGKRLKEADKRGT